MCLLLFKYPQEEIATENITCYKIIEKHLFVEIFKHKFYKYKTAMQKAKITLGKSYKAKFTFDTFIFDRFSATEHKRKTIEKGLHSFAKIEDAKLFCNHHFKHSFKDYVIVKCIIPKNTKFYRGMFDDSDAYSSTKIQYTKELFSTTTELEDKINKMFDEILKD